MPLRVGAGHQKPAWTKVRLSQSYHWNPRQDRPPHLLARRLGEGRE
jgi:hypothetical protein